VARDQGGALHRLSPLLSVEKYKELDAIGESQVMYASDYAHWDSEFPDSVKMVAATPGLDEARLKLVLGRNAIRWFDLKESDLPEKSVYF
jgi:predicted TIM-barrel fold metal-dependent hydrolase